MQEQEAPPSPSPSNSGSELPSSEDESPPVIKSTSISNQSQLPPLYRKKLPKIRAAPPPPPPRDVRKSQLSKR